MTLPEDSPPDPRVPMYLGRMLDGDGAPAGTCFQVTPGVLVTAYHVLDVIGAAEEGSSVRVDPLAGGDGFDGCVARIDPVHDLAVIRADRSLPDSAGPLALSDLVPLRANVTVTGHAVVDDDGRPYRYLDAPGSWAGGTTRDDAVPLGRLTANGVMPGMSGAPVIREDGPMAGAVAGVVSGRYNTADGWLKDSIWVARTEDLAPLLAGITDVTVEQPSYGAVVDLVFTVTGDRVRLRGPGVDVSATHSGVRPGLATAVDEVRRNRARAGLSSRSPAIVGADAGELALGRAGRLLAESFLPEPVAGEFGRVLRAADRAHSLVRVGIEASGMLARLPWEAMPDPYDGRPLALNPLVSVYRRVAAATPREVPGPLRIVVAIASPDDSGNGVLDYERELRNVIAAVRSARQGAADVRVVPFASPAAIRAALEQGPAHILHICGHGGPGFLELEDAGGAARQVNADELIDEAIPPGAVPPVIVLAACYTDVAAATGEPSLAVRLCERGAAVVIATETSITDFYATRVFARVYGALAKAGVPDAVTALADARREVQRELAESPADRDRELAALEEWAVVTVLAASGSVRVFDPSVTAAVPEPPPRPQIAGLAGRDTGYFVGRRREQRRWPAELAAPSIAGLVIHGIGGIGKTTLAAEITGRLLDEDSDRVWVTLTGPLTLDGLLGAVTGALRRRLLLRDEAGGDAMRAIDQVARSDLPWADRLAFLRDHLLDRVPLLVVLDNFEDNLQPAGTSQVLRDENLAGLIAMWVGSPGRSRLLVTSRFTFSLPGGAEKALLFRPVGPLSLAETMKLAWSLPALDRLLDARQLDRVWHLVGGHPRSLEYLDALLAGGTARYPDVDARLAAAVSPQLPPGTTAGDWLGSHTSLDAAIAEVVTLAADDVLIDELLDQLRRVPGAERLLFSVSVYREPVDRNALLFQVGESDESAADVPDRATAEERILAILADAGIAVDQSFDLQAVPASIRDLLSPHMADLTRQPSPPLRARADLPRQIKGCEASGLITIGTREDPGYFVHRWTATELAQRAADNADATLADIHRRSAAYWKWRVQVWPQDRAADLHDVLEARYHLLEAGDINEADQLSESICQELHTRGAWDEEASLIHDTTARLPRGSPRHAAWAHRYGTLIHGQGDYQEAEREYQRALEIYERLGNQTGIAACYGQQGILAQDQGDYDEATRGYQRALEIYERLDDPAGMATGYHQLGVLAQLRGDYEEAGRQCRRSLEIDERLGDQSGLATGYHQLGILAQLRGDFEEAGRQYRRSLKIYERLGDQSGMATSYHQLGTLAQLRGDFEEAGRQYRRSLDISERLGDQPGMATSYSQLGNLAASQDAIDAAIAWHVKALAIRLRLDVPQIANNIRNLTEYRDTLGTDRFAEILIEAVGGPEQAAVVISLLDAAAQGGDDS
jgi:tetratricopeptide (TPR) repeat protein